MALEARLHDRANVHNRRITSHQRLGCHLPAAKKDHLGIEAMFLEQARILRHPNMNLVIGNGRVPDFDLSLLGVRRRSYENSQQEYKRFDSQFVSNLQTKVSIFTCFANSNLRVNLDRGDVSYFRPTKRHYLQNKNPEVNVGARANLDPRRTGR